MQRPPRATWASLPGLANGQGRHAVGAALRPNLLLPGRPRPSSPPVRPTLSPTRDTDCGVRSALPSRVQLQDVDPPPASPAKGPHVHAPAPPAAASAETPLTATPLRAAPPGPGGGAAVPCPRHTTLSPGGALRPAEGGPRPHLPEPRWALPAEPVLTHGTGAGLTPAAQRVCRRPCPTGGETEAQGTASPRPSGGRGARPAGCWLSWSWAAIATKSQGARVHRTPTPVNDWKR